MQGWYEKECELAVQDRLQRETNDKKNDLESYIYSLRNKLSDVLADYAPQSMKDTLMQKLNEMEVPIPGHCCAAWRHDSLCGIVRSKASTTSGRANSQGHSQHTQDIKFSLAHVALHVLQDWLYDEGEDQTKSVYVEKLAGLRGHGEPIETRYVEAGVRKPAAQKLRGTANAYLNAAQSQDARYAHIDAADKKKVADLLCVPLQKCRQSSCFSACHAYTYACQQEMSALCCSGHSHLQSCTMCNCIWAQAQASHHALSTCCCHLRRWWMRRSGRWPGCRRRRPCSSRSRSMRTLCCCRLTSARRRTR
jgi:hypothetical protein